MEPADNPTTIRVDESLGDTDSSYGDDGDRELQTTSLYSTITKNVYENWRTAWRAGQCFCSPNIME